MDTATSKAHGATRSAVSHPGDLTRVRDDELRLRLETLVRQSRRVESVLVAHIAEVDARRVYVRHAPSMYAYCTRVLHLAEHEAYVRIAVARVSRRYPELLEMLGDGRLHPTGIAKLVPHLTDENRRELLARATHKTKAQIEELIAVWAPRADVAAAMRKLPVRSTPGADPQLGLDRVVSRREPDAVRSLDPAGDGLAPEVQLPASATRPPVSATPMSPPACETRAPAWPPSAAPVPPRPPAPSPPPLPVATPLAPDRYKIQFTASAALRAKLEHLQSLLRRDLEAAIEAAVTEKLARLMAERFAVTPRPRKGPTEPGTDVRSRHLPAAVKRIVWQRDAGRCTFVLADGSRCPERHRLEFHHRDPYGRGGSHQPDNVCLMCRAHNAHLAEREYGRAKIERHRRPPDGVSEARIRYVARSCRQIGR